MIPPELIQTKQTLDTLIDIYSTKHRSEYMSGCEAGGTYSTLKAYIDARNHTVSAIDCLLKN